MSSKVTGFSRHNPLKGKSKKPPESGGCCWAFGGLEVRRLELLGAAPVPPIPARPAIPVITAIPIVATAPIAVIAVHSAHEAMGSPAPAAETAFRMRQDRKPAFLGVVEGLVERVSRISDALHRCRRGHHGVGAIAQARHRIVRLLLILRIIPLRIHPRIGAID